MERNSIQLLPGTKKRLGIKVPGENRFLYIGSVILGAVLVAMFSFNKYESNLSAEIKSLNDRIIALEQKRNKKDETDLKIIKDRLTLTTNLLDQHAYWTQAFSWFENILQSDIQVKSMIINPVSNDFTFNANAASYTVIARQISAFLTDSRVSDVNVGKMTTNPEGTIKFDMSLKIDFSKLIHKK